MNSLKKALMHFVFYKFLFLLLPITGVLASNESSLPAVNVKQYTPDDGLQGVSVYVLGQGQQGFLWGGTPYGVFKFDGYKFFHYTRQEGLVNNAVWHLRNIRHHGLWFFSHNPTCAYYDGKQIRQFSLPDRFQPSRIHDAQVDPQGNFYLATPDGLYVKNADTTIHFGAQNSKLNDGYCNKFNWYQEALYFLDGEETIYKLIPGNNNNYHLQEYADPIPKKQEHFSDFNDKLFVYGGNEIYQVKNDSLELLAALPFDDLKMGAFTKAGDYYFFTTNGNGINVMDSTFQYIGKLPVLDEFSPTHMVSSKQGEIWVSSLERGLYELNFSNRLVKNFATEYSFTSITHHLSERKEVYASNIYGSIYQFTNEDSVKRIHTFPAQSNVTIENLYAQDDSMLWICTSIELVAFNTFKNEVKVLDKNDNKDFFSFKHVKPNNAKGLNFTKRIHRLNEHEWLVNSYRSISHLTRVGNNQFQIEEYWFNGEKINGFSSGKNSKKVFIATDDAIFYLEDDTIQKAHFSSFIQDVKINDILIKNKTYWIATAGDGLYRFFDGNIKKIDDITSDFVNSLEEGPYGDLWLSTNLGLQRIRVESNQPLSYSSNVFTKEDGFASNECNDLKHVDSCMWVATKKGVSRVQVTEQLQNEANDLQVYIREILINNKVYEGDSFQVRHHQNNLEVDYSVIYFGNQSNISFRYKIQGEEQTNWKETKARQVSFSSLKPGDYEFKVQAKLRSGPWSTHTASFSYSINPPFYQTNWFYASSCGTLFLIIAFIFYMRDHHVRKQEREKTLINQRMAQYELKALQAQMNPHFVSNVLNAIQALVLKKELQTANQYITKFAKMMRLVLESSRHEMVTLEDEKELLETYLTLEKLRFKEKLSFSISIDEALEQKNVYCPSFILQPIVENAIQHGGMDENTEALHLYIAFFNRNGKLVSQVQDNGPGFSQDNVKPDMQNEKHWQNNTFPSRGLSLVREKIEFLKTSQNIDISLNIQNLSQQSCKENGTRVEIICDLHHQ